jgi:FlaA1/EpsC-like NDP-sugar epimerase
MCLRDIVWPCANYRIGLFFVQLLNSKDSANADRSMPIRLLSSYSEKILELSRGEKRAIAIAVDIVLCLLTVALAYRLRLDAWIWPLGNQWLSYIAAVVLAIPLFVKFGLYRAIFRYIGWYALSAVTLACALYGAVYSLIFSVIGVDLIPRTTGFLQPILLFVGVGAARAIARFWLGGGYSAILGSSQKRRVLIYGAGSAGRQLAGGLASSQEMLVVAFIDDDPRLHGHHLNGKLIYPPSRLVKAIDDLAIDDVLLAMPSVSRNRTNEIVDSLKGHGVTVRTLPGIFELADGKVTINDLRPIQIEDLLGRDPVPPDPALMSKCIAGKTVLVTGAGGSIGSELCRQIITQKPTRLVLVDHSEYNLYAIDQELAALCCADDAIELVAILASVTDRLRIEELLQSYLPDTVYHAAAYKHVPLVEANPSEGVRNNVFGTLTVAELSKQYGVRDFVLISTDKAVRPPNIMGASKRLAEMVLQLMAQGSSTRFSMVRFGNVLGSSGSVVPLFRKQIAAGGPVTVTHTDVTRYFMTIPEAAQLVIQAGSMAHGGEVFVLDMGKPVKVIDLARRMIELSGFSIRDNKADKGDIEIAVTGLRPGEKMYEELLIGNDQSQTGHPLIMKAHEHCPSQPELSAVLQQLSELSGKDQDRELRLIVAKLVPEIRKNTGE